MKIRDQERIAGALRQGDVICSNCLPDEWDQMDEAEVILHQDLEDQELSYLCSSCKKDLRDGDTQ